MEKKVIALGFFDGVHLGHAALLRKTVEKAKELGLSPAVFTFDRPPKEVVTGRPVPLINSSEDRRDLARRLFGIEDVIIAPFDHHMMTMPWQNFVRDLLVGEQHAAHLVAGHDYHFGYKNEGSPALLREKCKELGLGCDIIAKVTKDGVIISSTLIRQLIAGGELTKAAAFLGHPHTLTQTVLHGKRIGRTIGIPTVNLVVPPPILAPGRGVYITRVYLPDGSSFAGVTNVGTRPTVNDGENMTVETYLVDYDGDLYGETLRVDFYKRLRGEEKFPSLDALKAQITCDIQTTRDYFSSLERI